MPPGGSWPAHALTFYEKQLTDGSPDPLYALTNFAPISFYADTSLTPVAATATQTSPPNYRYPTSEHYFQAMKFSDLFPVPASFTAWKGSERAISVEGQLFTRADLRARIRAAPAYGLRNKGPVSHPNTGVFTLANSGNGSFKSAIPPDWHSRRDPSSGELLKHLIMRKALLAKFSQNPGALRVLLATGKRPLIEASPYDPYWGWGPRKDGKNVLGQMLVEVRTLLGTPPLHGRPPTVYHSRGLRGVSP